MDIVQTFYDNLASQYDKLFEDWNTTTKEQSLILDKLFRTSGFGTNCRILDCACGIGTQAIGIAALGYDVTASDISDAELFEAKKRAFENGVDITFEKADFRCLGDTFHNKFDIIIAMDNALPHMLTDADLKKATGSIFNQLEDGGMFVASIRDYDTLLKDKPPYSAPYIHKTQDGQRIAFQTWNWKGNNYMLTQYIIEDGNELITSKYECEYRAVTRYELTGILTSAGFGSVEWKFPEETGFYQPVVIAKKKS